MPQSRETRASTSAPCPPFPSASTQHNHPGFLKWLLKHPTHILSHIPHPGSADSSHFLVDTDTLLQPLLLKTFHSDTLCYQASLLEDELQINSTVWGCYARARYKTKWMVKPWIWVLGKWNLASSKPQIYERYLLFISICVHIKYSTQHLESDVGIISNRNKHHVWVLIVIPLSGDKTTALQTGKHHQQNHGHIHKYDTQYMTTIGRLW